MTELITHHSMWVLAVFLLGYAIIVIEEYVRFSKAATAIIMGVACWTILFMEPDESVERHLSTLGVQMFKVSQVLFFLMGALTIVEIMNSHKAFKTVTENLFVSSKRTLLWIVALLTFFMSSVLDNLTTTVVMVTLAQKVLENREDRLILGGIIVIAANAGGTWTPIGDVSTTLLWINGQVTTLPLMRDLFLPSIVCTLVPVLWLSRGFTGPITHCNVKAHESVHDRFGMPLLILGIASLVFVPIFKVITEIPPFMGIMLSLGVLWIITDVMHSEYEERHHLRVCSILPKIDMSVIFFYLGILLSINALESAGILHQTALWLSHHVPQPNSIAVLVGLISSVIDNVSLVAATIGMYGLETFQPDSEFWQLITYCAGTGGSILIIGSAAGIAFMSLEKVEFMWYFRNITPKALAGYFAGVILYLAIYWGM